MIKGSLIYFTHHGKQIGEEIINATKLDTQWSVYDKGYETLDVFVENQFSDSQLMIFIGASGIAVRKLAPHIQSKASDPAVVVIDDGGNFVIPLLSGHLGGANEWAKKLAEILKATAVITTSTDVNKVFAIDNWCKENNCAIGDLSKIKKVSAALIAGEKVGFQSDFKIEGNLPNGFKSEDSFELSNETIEKKYTVGVLVSFSERRKVFTETFHAIPKAVVLGVGCRKGVDSQVFENVILEQLEKNDISLKAVTSMYSIDLKKSEQCILDFSQKYNIPFNTFTADELKKVDGEFTPSSFVAGITGVDNVCERSAIKGSNGRLISRKFAGQGVTLAIAKKDWKCKF